VHNLAYVCDTRVAVVSLLYVVYLCPSSQGIHFVPHSILTVLEGKYALGLRAGKDGLVTSINNNDDATLFAGHMKTVVAKNVITICHLQRSCYTGYTTTENNNIVIVKSE
jgi:hypothetical protein